jgi:hypothetical protein
MAKDLVAKKMITHLLDLFPQAREQVIVLQGKKFTLSDDLLLIDQTGVPYTVRFENGDYQIYPVADKTYTLLGWGGNVNGVKGLQRDLNRFLEDSMQLNIEFLTKVSEDPALASRVKIERYERIEKANLNDQYVIENWQVPLLLEVTKIKENPLTDPMAVLVQNRGDVTENPRLGRTYVEKVFFKGESSVAPPDVIGHYLLMDQRFHELNIHVTSGRDQSLRDPELQQVLVRQIAESREKLHTAARVVLKPFLQEIANMTPETRTYLMQHPQFRLVYEYFIRTPLAVESLAIAGQHLDLGKTVVLRSSSDSKVKMMGFMSDVQIRDGILSIPFVGPRFEGFLNALKTEMKQIKLAEEYASKPTPALEKAVAEKVKSPALVRLVAKFANGNPTIEGALRGLLTYVFIQPYEHRTLDPESGRAFATQYLHTQLDKGPKEALSTTVNPAYLLNDKGTVFEAKFAWQDATIYIIEVPRENLRVDVSSGFVIQQEVGMRPMGPLTSRRAIQFRLKADELNSFLLPKAPPTPEAVRAIDLLKDSPLKNSDDQGRLRWLFKVEDESLQAARL